MTKWVPETQTATGPKYLSVVEALERDIVSGRLSDGDRLPPQREIAEMFGVTIATVTKAIGEAARRGIVVAKKGSGTFVRVAKGGGAAEAEGAVGARVIDLGLNTLPVGTVSDLLDAAMLELASGHSSQRCFAYASYLGDESSLRVARHWLEVSGWRLGDGTIFPTQGVQQGLTAAIGCLAERGDTILCEALTYTGILRIAELYGLKPQGIALDAEGMVPAALEAALERSKAKVVVVTPTTHNPTTCTMSARRREEIAGVCRRHEAYLIEDGINAPLADGEEPPVSSFLPERSIFLTGFSKCVAPGFRLGYAAVPQELHNRFYEILITTSWLSPPFFAELAATMIESGALQDCILRHRKEAQLRLALAGRVLGLDLGKTPAPSYHAWVKVPEGWRMETLVQQAFAEGVRITPSQHFCCPGVTPPAAFRISLGAEEDRGNLEDGLKRLAAVMQTPTLFQGPII